MVNGGMKWDYKAYTQAGKRFSTIVEPSDKRMGAH
jgi:hypothetical protein